MGIIKVIYSVSNKEHDIVRFSNIFQFRINPKIFMEVRA